MQSVSEPGVQEDPAGLYIVFSGMERFSSPDLLLKQTSTQQFVIKIPMLQVILGAVRAFMDAVAQTMDHSPICPISDSRRSFLAEEEPWGGRDPALGCI